MLRALAPTLVCFIGGFSLMGCTIVTESSQPNNPPPPPHMNQPPPPPAQPNTAPPPVQPAQPGKPQLKYKNWKPQTPPAPQGTPGFGTIAISVVNGSCVVTVGNIALGNQSGNTQMEVQVGQHVVNCAPPSGQLQTRTVQVSEATVTQVSFNVGTPTKTTTTSRPVTIKPPVGRPTPGQ